jgi:hypothetical protein
MYSYARGHKVYFNPEDEIWRYADTNEIFDDSRQIKIRFYKIKECV